MKYWLLAAAAALLLAGCEPTFPMADRADEARGKQFLPPPPDRAVLYVYRVVGAGSVPFVMSLDQRQLGAVSGTTWLRVEEKPGVRDLRCFTEGIEAAAPASLRVDLRPGQTTFVEARYIHFSDPHCGLAEVPATVGRPGVLAGHRIREVGGASD
jgi:hypothetical protein